MGIDQLQHCSNSNKNGHPTSSIFLKERKGWFSLSISAASPNFFGIHWLLAMTRACLCHCLVLFFRRRFGFCNPKIFQLKNHWQGAWQWAEYTWQEWQGLSAVLWWQCKKVTWRINLFSEQPLKWQWQRKKEKSAYICSEEVFLYDLVRLTSDISDLVCSYKFRLLLRHLGIKLISLICYAQWVKNCDIYCI